MVWLLQLTRLSVCHDGIWRCLVQEGAQRELIGHGAGDHEGGRLLTANGSHLTLESGGRFVLSVNIIVQSGSSDSIEHADGGCSYHITCEAGQIWSFQQPLSFSTSLTVHFSRIQRQECGILDRKLDCLLLKS